MFRILLMATHFWTLIAKLTTCSPHLHEKSAFFFNKVVSFWNLRQRFMIMNMFASFSLVYPNNCIVCIVCCSYIGGGFWYSRNSRAMWLYDEAVYLLFDAGWRRTCKKHSGRGYIGHSVDLSHETFFESVHFDFWSGKQLKFQCQYVWMYYLIVVLLCSLWPTYDPWTYGR